MRAPGFAELVTDVLEPATAPDPLELTVRPAPALRGVVFADGRAAAGARVRLYGILDSKRPGLTRLLEASPWEGSGEPFVYRVNTQPLATSETKSDGTFVLQPRSDLQHLVLVDPEGWATARSEAVALAPGEAREITFELKRGGAVAGKLLLTDGESSAGWTVRANDTLGDVRSVTLGARSTEGTDEYSLGALSSGRWQVRAFAPGVDFTGFTTAAADDVAPVFDIEVLEGKTTAFDLDVEHRPRGVLEGLLEIDGAPAGPWTALLYRTDGRFEQTRRSDELDPAGRFRIELEVGTKYALVLSGHSSEWAHLEVRDAIVARAGTQSWELRLQTSDLAGGAQPQREESFEHRWAGPGEVRTGALIHVEEGRFGPLRVPIGRGEIVRLEDCGLSNPPVLLTFDVPASGLLGLELP